MSKSLIFSLFIGFLLQLSCHNSKTINKIMHTKVSSKITVNQIFIQEEIAGTKGEKSKIYLSLEIQPFSDADIVIDSLVFESTYFKNISTAGANAIRIDLEKRTTPFFTAEGDQLTIYFKKETEFYRQVVSQIVVKEPIYLP
jgi:ribosomal protein L31